MWAKYLNNKLSIYIYSQHVCRRLKVCSTVFINNYITYTTEELSKFIYDFYGDVLCMWRKMIDSQKEVYFSISSQGSQESPTACRLINIYMATAVSYSLSFDTTRLHLSVGWDGAVHYLSSSTDVHVSVSVSVHKHPQLYLHVYISLITEEMSCNNSCGFGNIL